MPTEEVNKVIAERLVASLESMMKEVEPLPNLTIPVEKLLVIIGALQSNMEQRDFSMALMIISLLYEIDDENDFMKRLAKTVMTAKIKEDEE